MSVRVTHTLDDLARDVAKAPQREAREMTRVVDELGRFGRTVARNDARPKAGTHGVHYPNSITHESRNSLGSWSTEWGPDGAKDQGNMNFEHGPGPQSTPHLSIAISHDAVKPLISRRVGGVYDGGVYQ